MGAPNIQQQLYLKTALNESKEGMFDHPSELGEGWKSLKKTKADLNAIRKKGHKVSVQHGEGDTLYRVSRKKKKRVNEEQLGEGYHRKSIRAAKAGKYQLSADLSDRAEASGLRRGGASERTIKQHFNKGDYAIGSRAQNRFAKDAARKQRVALRAKGLAEEQLGEGKFNRAKRLLTRGTYERALAANAAMQRQDAREMMRGGASPAAVKRYFNNGQSDAAHSAQHRFIMSGIKKRREALKAKGLMEGSRGVQRLKRIMKSVKKNYAQGKAMIGTRNADVAMRELVSPNSPETQASRAALHAGVAHMGKKKGLRGQISSRTRAAAMRERGRAGLNPRLPGGSAMMSKNETGGYEHTENPKRVPSAVKTYRKASAVKRNMYR